MMKSKHKQISLFKSGGRGGIISEGRKIKGHWG
jgi:hypothetical protein